MNTLKSLATGIGAIALASAVLLVSDRPAKRVVIDDGAEHESMRRVAVLQHASQPIIDDGYAGTLAGLEESGFVEGKNLELVRRNNEGDVVTANLMAQEIVSGDYDLAASLTTPSLQALAAANKAGKV
ncbi:MAG TPA: ABC transporter substrate binding protein, partial [Planctomycetaceae bacterium]